MGLPLAPTFANIFMCFYESIWLDECPLDFKPVFYRRYIDDTFMIFKHHSHVPLFLEYLNSKHVNIKFTHEIENNNSLSFLDCKIFRNNGRYECSVYRKPSFSGLGTSFYSFSCIKFKINSIKTLFSRAYNICSNYLSFHEEVVFLKNFFKNNGFCSKLIENQLNKFLRNKYCNERLQQSQNSPSIYLTFPYFGPNSEKLKQDIIKVVHKYFLNVNVKIILVNKFTIGSFFNFKDRLPLSMLSSAVYKFSCEKCSSDYVGMTSRNLYMRVAEHCGRSYRTNVPLTHPPHSVVREHSQECDVTVSLSNFNILATSNNSIDLKILESLHIHQIKPKLNSQISSFPLAIVSR